MKHGWEKQWCTCESDIQILLKVEEIISHVPNREESRSYPPKLGVRVRRESDYQTLSKVEKIISHVPNREDSRSHQNMLYIVIFFVAPVQVQDGVLSATNSFKRSKGKKF